MPHTNRSTRRQLLRNLAIAPAIGVTTYTSGSWVKPVIQTAILPAHAQTSESNDINLQPKPIINTISIPVTSTFPDDIGSVNTAILIAGDLNSSVGTPNTVYAVIDYESTTTGTTYNVTFYQVNSQGVETLLFGDGAGATGVQIATIVINGNITIMINGVTYSGTYDSEFNAQQGSAYLTLDVDPILP